MIEEAKDRLTEVYSVPDTFISGLGEIEDLGGGCYRFVFFAKQHVGGREELVVVAKLIVTTEAVPKIMRAAATHMGMCVCAKGSGMPLN